MHAGQLQSYIEQERIEIIMGATWDNAAQPERNQLREKLMHMHHECITNIKLVIVFLMHHS